MNRLIILSSSYVKDGIEGIFGKTIPIFLPIGGNFFLKHILDKVKHKEVFVTIPSSLDSKFLNKIKDLNLISIDDNKFWFNALIEAVSKIPKLKKNEIIKVVFGDTLLNWDKFEENLVIGYTIDPSFLNYSQIDNIKSIEGREFFFNGILTITLNVIEALKTEQNILTETDFLNILLKDEYKLIEFKDLRNISRPFSFFNLSKEFLITRYFNDLVFTNHSIIKKSLNQNKINGEINWYRSLPMEVSYIAPKLINYKKSNFYEIEYLPFASLSDILIYGNRPEEWWIMLSQKILDIFQILTTQNKSIKEKKFSQFLESLVNKTKERINDLKELDFDSFILFSNIYKNHYEFSNNNYIDFKYSDSLIHGDFCFSNILYDEKTNNLKLIDPRGLDFNNRISNHGFIVYDIIKLLHSSFGKYDLIINNQYIIEKDELIFIINYNLEKFDEFFFRYLKVNYDISREITIKLIINLFVTMLPLHSENKIRVRAFILNIKRLNNLI